MKQTVLKLKDFLKRQVVGVKGVSRTTGVLKEVYNERGYQDKLWGGKGFDTTHTEAEWLTWISEYAYGNGRAAGRAFRERMIKTAALAVAAVEALDVKNKQEEEANSNVPVATQNIPPSSPGC